MEANLASIAGIFVGCASVFLRVILKPIIWSLIKRSLNGTRLRSNSR